MPKISSIFIVLLLVNQMALAGDDKLNKKFDFKIEKTIIKKSSYFADSDIDKISMSAPRPIAMGDLAKESLDEIKTRILAYEKIKSKTKSPEKLNSLNLNLLTSYLQLAKKLSVKVDHQEASDEISAYLKKASLAGQDLQKAKITADKKAYALYLLGLCQVNLGNPEEAIRDLEQSVDIDPKVSFAKSVSIYLGDAYFASHNYEKADAAYRRFYAQLNDADRDYVDFKIAWIFINQSKFDEAENLLKGIAVKKEQSKIVRDSVNSLAFVIDKNLSQEVAVQRSKQYFKDPESLKSFLWALYLQAQRSTDKRRDLIAKELLAVETRPEERLKIWLTEIRWYRERNDVRSQAEEFLNMVRDLGSEKIFSSKELAQYLSEIEQESEALLASLYHFYSANQKNAKALYFEDLLKVVNFHLNFTNSKNYDEILLLKVQMLSERPPKERDSDELVKATTLAINRNKDPKLLRWLHDLRADTYENSSSASGSNKAALYSELELLAQDQKSPNWSPVVNKLIAYSMADAKYPEARQWAEKLYAQNHAESNLATLFSVNFTAGDCEQVSKISYSGKNEKILGYKRECYLKLAESSRGDTSNRDKYYSNILKFIKESNDSSKKSVAIQDLFNNLQKDKDDVRMHRFLFGDFAATRFTERIVEYSIGLMNSDILKADWVNVRKLASGCKTEKSCATIRRLDDFAKIAAAKEPARILWSKEPTEQIDYFENNWAILEPESFIRSLLKVNMAAALKRPSVKKQLLIAGEILDTDYSNQKNKALFVVVKDYLPKNRYPSNDVMSINNFKKMKWPIDPIHHQLSDKDILTMSQALQNNRRILVQDLKKLSLPSKRSLLTLAMESENKMGTIIENSRIPKQLSDAQVAEYKKGLTELASEFFKQSEQYKISIQEIEQKENEQTAIQSEDKVPNFNAMSDWLPPNGLEELSGVKKMWEQKMPRAALMIADFAFEQKKIDTEAYYKLRTGILISTRKTDGIKSYALRELTAKNQNSVISYWKGLK